MKMRLLKMSFTYLGMGDILKKERLFFSSVLKHEFNEKWETDQLITQSVTSFYLLYLPAFLSLIYLCSSDLP